MPIDKISMRQLLVLLFTALLSPAIQILPGQTAAIAGRAGWLSAVAALPVLLGLCWVFFALFRDRGPGEGLSEVFGHVLGPVAGKLLSVVYLVWGIVLLGTNARRFALRFLSTSYRNASLALFIVVVLGLALWMARGKLGALVRAGEVFYLALALVLGVTILLGFFEVEPRNVLPIWVDDLPAAASAALPVLSVLGYAVYAGFLAGGVISKKQNLRKTIQWAAIFCGVLTALQFVCMGSFGPSLVGRMDTPYFMMVKGVGVEGAFERIESVVVALWVFSDLALLGLLLFACRVLCQNIFSLKEGKSTAFPIAILALGVAFFLLPDAFALFDFMEHWVSMGNLLLGFAVPAALLVIAKVRKLLA